MHSELSVRFDAQHAFTFPLDQAQPMDPRAARAWLDREFIRYACEPLRRSGKVLNADKVVCVAQAAGRQGFADPEWARAFASAAHAALDQEVILIDATMASVTFCPPAPAIPGMRTAPHS